MPPPSAYETEVLFDGECPLCRREIALLRRMDGRARLRFTDVAAEGFSASAGDPRIDELMAQIHARTTARSSPIAPKATRDATRART